MLIKYFSLLATDDLKKYHTPNYTAWQNYYSMFMIILEILRFFFLRFLTSFFNNSPMGKWCNYPKIVKSPPPFLTRRNGKCIAQFSIWLLFVDIFIISYCVLFKLFIDCSRTRHRFFFNDFT